MKSCKGHTNILNKSWRRVQGGPTIEQRFDSYYNYCKLFNYILSADTPVNLELPNQWLWEIIDEFIYQFQVGFLFIRSFYLLSRRSPSTAPSSPRRRRRRSRP